MKIIGIILVTSIKPGLISPRNASSIHTKMNEEPPWNNTFTPTTNQMTREVMTNSAQPNKESFKLDEDLKRRPRRWEVHHQIPQTAESITESLARATKMILDPYKILELVVRSIPESLRILGWYLALAVTFMWCLVVLIIGGYATYQALRILFGMTRYCGKGAKTCIIHMYRNKKRRTTSNKPKIVKSAPI